MRRRTKATSIAWKDTAEEVMLEQRSKTRDKSNCRDTGMEIKGKCGLNTVNLREPGKIRIP